MMRILQRATASRNRVGGKLFSSLAILCLLAAMRIGTFGSTLPPYFIEESIGGEWNEACGLAFDSTGRMYVWERGGRVWIVGTDGVRLPQPLIDISEEVGAWRDFGMLGFALDPQFEQNGYLYLSYVVDRHYLTKFGTAAYNPNTNEFFQATIGRVTRYTARASDGFRTVDPASRHVLVGESISTGFPIMHQSHGVGSLVFGTDGTLLVSAGDGASYTGADAGGSVGENYAAQALADGIIQAKENVGAYRAQMVDSLAGKVIRIDPATGDGIPSNPFYDSAHARSARSRVWALGVRNPCRMTLRPGSGSANPADARPGVLYLGDVGWSGWEELNVVTRPGQNFGWPVFEGMESQSEYDQYRAQNRDAPNPLYGRAGCTQRYFSFHDLIQDDTLAPNPWFPNPCDPSQAIPASIPQFVLSRAAIEWRDWARTGSYDVDGNATIVALGSPGSPVTSSQFTGECSIGGVWYAGDDFPSNYKNTYFHADFESGWIRNFVFDQNNKPVAVRDFLSDGGGVVAIATHPTQGGLYYVRWGMEVVKISYSLNANQRPVAVASVDKTFGPSPLSVQFTGSNSSDPEGSTLNYRWDFGDGTATSAGVNPQHVFQAPAGVPTRYTTTLTVTDTNGSSATTRIAISVNNTPPSVTILNPVDGTRYPLTGDTVYQLSANVSDAEYPDDQLSYRWQVILHHNDHTHSEPVDSERAPTAVISPIGCSGGETYHFRIVLTVTDPGGLSATNEANVYPDCDGVLPAETFPTPWLQQDIGAVSAAGSGSYSNHIFWVAGSGDDIWGNADEFRFVYWAQTGDAQVSARVASQENTLNGAKAGVMMRENLQAGSRYAMVAVTPDGLLFQYRTTPNGASSYQQFFDLAAPYWVKLVRAGNRFTGYASPDGIAWTPFTSVTLSMVTAISGGLAVTSHSDGILSMAMFDHVVGITGITAPSVGPLPAPWQSGDVGSIIVAGGASYNNSVFTASGSGEGIWDTADAFQFVQLPWSGDVEVITRLLSLQETAAWAKAGVMIRETLEADSPAVFLALTPRYGAGLQSRQSEGAGSTFTRGPGLAAPAWLKLVRHSNDFDGSVSIDGSTWSHVGTHTIAMAANVSVGLAVTSSDSSRLNTARFTNVAVRTPQQPLDPGVEEPNWPVPRLMPRVVLLPSGQSSQLIVKVEDHPGHHHQLQRSSDLIDWQPVATLDNRSGTTFFVDSILANSSQRFYRVIVLP